MDRSYVRWLPLTGILFIALAITGFIVGGEPPDAAGNSADEIVQFYTDNQDRVMASIIILSVATVLFVFFAPTYDRCSTAAPARTGCSPASRSSAPWCSPSAPPSTAPCSSRSARRPGEVEPAQIETLQAFWDNDFLPLAMGIVLFTLGSGISIVLHKSLPVWLGWIAIVLGIVGMTPIGWVAFMGTGVWILIVSVMLLMSERKVAAPVVQ